MEDYLSDSPEFDRSIRRALVGLICVVLIMLTLLSVVRNHASSTAEAIPSSRVFVTAAHIPESEFPNCIRIYSDEESDVAIYYDPRYEATHVRDGSIASYAGLTGTVEYSDGNNFYLIPDDPNSTVKGLSGSPVYVDGAPIGFISAMVTGGKLRCVYY